MIKVSCSLIYTWMIAKVCKLYVTYSLQPTKFQDSKEEVREYTGVAGM